MFYFLSNFKRLTKAALLLLVLLPYSANAIIITHLSDLSFGKAVKPSSEVRIVLDYDGTLRGNTNATMIGSGNLSLGSDFITRSFLEQNKKISISMTECGTNQNSLGLRLRRFRITYQHPSGDVQFINNKSNLKRLGTGRTVTYGGKLVIFPTVSTGTINPCYNLDVNYD